MNNIVLHKISKWRNKFYRSFKEKIQTEKYKWITRLKN